jgi:hypothetical protein
MGSCVVQIWCFKMCSPFQCLSDLNINSGTPVETCLHFVRVKAIARILCKTNLLRNKLIKSKTFILLPFSRDRHFVLFLFKINSDIGNLIAGRTPWTGNQLVARPLPTHRTTQTQTSMPRVGFEHTIPKSEQRKTFSALDRAATLIVKAFIFKKYFI